MATPAVNLPPLPAGFTLDTPGAGQEELPPLPPGFTLDQQASDQFAGDDLLSPESMASLEGGAPSTVTPTPERSFGEKAVRYGKEYLGGLKEASQAPGKTAQPQTFAEHLGNVPVAGPLFGAGEAALSLGSGLLAPFAAFADPNNPEAAAQRAIYEPRSAPGKAALGMIGAASKPLTDVAAATGADVALLPLAAETQALSTVTRAKAPKVPKPVKEAVPSTDELGEAAKRAYQTAKDAGAVVSPESYARMASGVRGSLREQGFNPKLHPKAAAVLDEIEAAQGQPQSFQELEILRRQALAAERSIEADERRIAGLIIDKLDDYGDVLIASPQDVMAGSARTAVEATREARSLYSRNRKASEMAELLERARSRAPAFSGSGLENAIRTEFRQLSLNQKRLRRFTQEEQTAIKRVANGGVPENLLRQVGKLAPTGGLSQWLSLGAAFLHPAALAVPVLGLGARAGATRMTLRNVRRAEEIMRRGPARRASQAEPAAAPALSQADEIDRAGAAFDAERAAAAQAARGGYEVGEAPSESITLETSPRNRVQQLSPLRSARLTAELLSPERSAARSSVATLTQAPRSVAIVEAEIRDLTRRAASLPLGDQQVQAIEAQYAQLVDELARARARAGRRNRVTQLSGGR